MTIQQMTLGIDRSPKFVGNTMTTSALASTLTFNYPSNGAIGDLIVAYVVAENKVVPVLPTGWTSLYSNTVTAINGPGSGRLLMYKRRGTENSANVDLTPGGGNCTCVSLRNVNGDFANVVEIGVDTSSSQNLSYNITASDFYVTLVNEDGANTSPVINISGATEYFHYEPGYYNSMAIGYVKSTENVSGNVTISMTDDLAYAIGFKVS